MDHHQITRLGPCAREQQHRHAAAAKQCKAHRSQRARSPAKAWGDVLVAMNLRVGLCAVHPAHTSRRQWQWQCRRGCQQGARNPVSATISIAIAISGHTIVDS